MHALVMLIDAMYVPWDYYDAEIPLTDPKAFIYCYSTGLCYQVRGIYSLFEPVCSRRVPGEADYC